MSIKGSIASMLRLLGDNVSVEYNGEKHSGKAVIQPLLYKNKMYISGKDIPLGYLDQGHYLMIAPMDIGITDYRDTIVEDNGTRYMIKRAEVVRSGDCDLYIWAVLSLCNDKTEDDYELTELHS